MLDIDIPKVLWQNKQFIVMEKMEGSKSTLFEDILCNAILKVSSRLDKIKILNKKQKGLSVMLFEKINSRIGNYF